MDTTQYLNLEELAAGELPVKYKNLSCKTMNSKINVMENNYKGDCPDTEKGLEG